MGRHGNTGGGQGWFAGRPWIAVQNGRIALPHHQTGGAGGCATRVSLGCFFLVCSKAHPSRPGFVGCLVCRGGLHGTALFHTPPQVL